MRTLLRLLPAYVLAALIAAGSPLRAQDAPVRADTIHGADFSDRTISRAFGLPDATSEHVSLARERMRCGQTEDAILCNIDAPDGSLNDCADIALVGHFIVWFDMFGGKKVDKRIYVAVDCLEHTVTMSSLSQFPATEFTLLSRENDSTQDEIRTVVFIQTGSE